MIEFSVLISVYYKDNPNYLKLALESIYINQTVKPTQIVLVKDGKLTNELDVIINEFINNFANVFKIISLERNRGLANALRIGGNSCDYDLIARMDSDDIAFPDRFEKQIKHLLNNNLDIVGGQIIEFGKDISDVISERKVPLKHSEIIRFLKFRSPFSHPTIIFKKKVFDDLKGYDPEVFPEDYDFFVRAHLKGYKFGNLKENVLWFRIGEKDDSLKRRWGMNYAKKEIKLYRKFLHLGFYSFFDFIKVFFLKIPIRILPFPVFKFLYFNFLRKRFWKFIF
jgi:cellulose synthase/poly-beta-1,6-N-acetylglucosamine synthase-like glycosyltransferase